MVNDGGASYDVRLIVDWIKNQPALRAILTEAELREPHLDFESFNTSFEQMRAGNISWPNTTPEGRATLVWDVMNRIAADTSGDDRMCIAYYSNVFNGYPSQNLTERWHTFVAQVIQPLFDFLEERISDLSSALFVLQRYVRRVEWFDRVSLHDRFKADTRNGEEVYNLDLQRFLFLDGNYITYAKARSASGEADLVGDVGAGDLLICEGKIFDGGSRGKGYLAKGVNQLVQYAQDYKTSVAYLVIFNIDARELDLPTEGPAGDWPRYIEMSGVRLYLVPVRALPPETTASKLGKANPHRITRADLISPAATL